MNDKKNNAIKRALNSVSEALLELDKELSRGEITKEYFTTPHQLEHFKNSLLTIQKELMSVDFSFTLFGIGHMIADSWPYENKLGELLAKAENDYLELKNINT